MSIVTNGRVNNGDQRVDKEKFAANFDAIKWKSKNESKISSKQPARKA